MLFNIALILSAATAATAAACPVTNQWKAPSATDRRGPCPMVNSLANHGYLPRNGLNISLADLITAFTDAINLDPAATTLVGNKAVTTGNNVTFDLDNLSKHGIIEHDGSLSRNDIYFGDNYSFDEDIWAGVAAHFTNETISIETAAAARKERLSVAAAANPEFSLPADGIQFSYIETALYLSVFGNITTGNAVTKWVKVLFEQERLPFKEGFTRSDDIITAAGILGLVSKVAAASA